MGWRRAGFEREGPVSTHAGLLRAHRLGVHFSANAKPPRKPPVWAADSPARVLAVWGQRSSGPWGACPMPALQGSSGNAVGHTHDPKKGSDGRSGNRRAAPLMVRAGVY